MKTSGFNSLIFESIQTIRLMAHLLDGGYSFEEVYDRFVEMAPNSRLSILLLENQKAFGDRKAKLEILVDSIQKLSLHSRETIGIILDCSIRTGASTGHILKEIAAFEEDLACKGQPKTHLSPEYFLGLEKLSGALTLIRMLLNTGATFHDAEQLAQQKFHPEFAGFSSFSNQETRVFYEMYLLGKTLLLSPCGNIAEYVSDLAASTRRYLLMAGQPPGKAKSKVKEIIFGSQRIK